MLKIQYADQRIHKDHDPRHLIINKNLQKMKKKIRQIMLFKRSLYIDMTVKKWPMERVQEDIRRIEIRLQGIEDRKK